MEEENDKGHTDITDIRGGPRDFKIPDDWTSSDGVPLVLFGNSKNPILIPPSIADLLRDKPPDSELNYMDDDEVIEEKESPPSSDSEIVSQEDDVFHGVEVHGERGHLAPSSNTSGIKSNSTFWSQFKTITPKLVPFLKTLGLYFVIFIPEDRPSWFGLFIKCLPVLSLALFVLLHGISLAEELVIY